MNIFLSYASEQSDIAEGVEVALRAEGHEIFRDRSGLPSGETYHERIRTAIDGSELFVFLVSPDSVSPGRYTITELEFARERWPNPSGHVLPVVVQATDKAAIPPYLKAVTLLEPRGNLQASVAAAVARLAAPPWRRFVRRRAALLALLTVAALVAAGVMAQHLMVRARVARDVAEALDAGRLHRTSGDYRAAWAAYDRALALSPRDAAVEAEQERLAMDWLENIRVTVGTDTFSSIVDAVQPAIVRCTRSTDAVRSADCFAHLGWGEYLRKRDGKIDADPVAHYRRALEIDPVNVYGHAMWGHYLLASRRPVAEAAGHFDEALASGREHAYVRHLHIAGLLFVPSADAENELLRIVNDMRTTGEDLARGASDETSSEAAHLWNIYYSRILSRSGQASFRAALSAADHLATFQWIFPDAQVRPDRRNLHLFVLGTLQEWAGDRAEALATFQSVRDALARDGTLGAEGSLPAGTRAALSRLSR